jgi:hypothetical protein
VKQRYGSPSWINQFFHRGGAEFAEIQGKEFGGWAWLRIHFLQICGRHADPKRNVGDQAGTPDNRQAKQLRECMGVSEAAANRRLF